MKYIKTNHKIFHKALANFKNFQEIKTVTQGLLDFYKNSSSLL
jgi:hypothetical protein